MDLGEPFYSFVLKFVAVNFDKPDESIVGFILPAELFPTLGRLLATTARKFAIIKQNCDGNKTKKIVI